MKLDELQMEYHTTCVNDMLELVDNSNAHQTSPTRLCGTYYHGNWMLTSSNQLALTFVSNNHRTYKGFLLNVQGKT